MSRTRNYASILYEESAPKNWRQILEDCFVPMIISPYHNKDINPNGEPKKPHYHIIIMFDSVKTCEQAREIFEKVNAVGCEYVKSIRGYARYLCHLDNPDKAQYNIEDVISMSGADYLGIIGLACDKYKAVAEMIDFIDSNKVPSYAYLLRYARNGRFDWFKLLCDNSSYVIKEYISAKNRDLYIANNEKLSNDAEIQSKRMQEENLKQAKAKKNNKNPLLK